MRFGRRKDDVSRPTQTTPTGLPPIAPVAITLSASLIVAGPRGRIVLRELTPGADAWRRSMRDLQALRGAGDLAVGIQPEDRRPIPFVGLLETVEANGTIVLREIDGGAARTRLLVALGKLHQDQRENLLVTLRRLS